MRSRQHAGDADPGVISDSDDDFGVSEKSFRNEDDGFY